MYRSEKNPKYSFQTLFTVLLLAMLIPAFLYRNPALNIIFNIFISIIALAAIYSLSIKRLYFMITVILAVATISTTWLELSTDQTMAMVLDHGLNFIFFAYLAFLLGIRVFRSKEITGDTVFGALCIYLLLGYTFGFMFMTMDIINPESFNVGTQEENTPTYIYYSFVTLTTLGYGDIIPHNPPSQILAIIEAITGQFYLAVVVARFVALLSTERRQFAKSPRQKTHEPAPDATT